MSSTDAPATQAPVDEDTLRRYADLLVVFAANLQPGQILSIGTEPGKERMTRLLAESAYRHGAKFVDMQYFDPHVKRSRLLHAAEDTLEYVPPWYGERMLALSDEHAARIFLSGPVEPHLFEDVDPERAGRDRLPFLKESGPVVNAMTTNWAIAPLPTRGWAELVHPDLDPDEAEARLWEQVLHILRMDEADPVAAWVQRADELEAMGARLTELALDAVHFEGPGTDLIVGLLPSSQWIGGRMTTVDGVVHMANLPTEEVFTTPDPERTEGVVRSTMPLELAGTIVRGLEVRFEGGRAVSVEAEEGGEVLAGRTQADEGAARLGEVALVDRESRIGKSGTVFFDTLLDENAASHIALGGAYDLAIGEDADKARANRSVIHIDFMIGGDDVAVTGITGGGDRIPLLRGGAWQL